MPFTQKQLRFTFNLVDGSNITVSGVRASVSIQQSGGIDIGNAEVSIYGLTPSVMNSLSTLGQNVSFVPRNAIVIEAGDSVTGLSVVYQGTIIRAYGDYASMPNVSFHLVANPYASYAVQPIPPTTINSGFADVATIMSGLAQQASPPLHFENTGVNQTIAYPYLPGTVMDQIHAVAAKAGINHSIDATTQTLAIWPKGAARGDAVLMMSAETGMIGYPAFSSEGIIITSIFNSSVTFGQRIQVKSSLPAATGTYFVSTLSHDLESMVPNGQWHTRFLCAIPGNFQLAPSRTP
jgi:hypothetical protein